MSPRISYELALDLREAGFPQDRWSGGGWRYLGDENSLRLDTKCYEPTLDQLIEACGEGFGSLEKSGTQFIALEPKHRQTILILAYQETPEEAVARLWLAINVPKVV